MNRKPVLTALVAMILLATAAFVPAVREPVLQIGTILGENTALVIGLTTGLALVAAIAALLAVRRARSFKRDIDEVMRAGKRHKPQPAVSPVSAEVQPKAERQISALKSDDPFPGLSVIVGGKAKAADTAAADLPAPKKAVHARHQHFQPILAMPDCKVAAYDVFRAVQYPDRKKQVLEQHSDAPNKADRAAYEFRMVEQAAAAARQVVCLPENGGNDIRLIVHVTDALIDDTSLWNELVALVRAHPVAAANLMLAISADAVTGKSGKERMAKLDRLPGNTISFALTGAVAAPVLDQHELAMFSMVIIDRDDVVSAGETSELLLRASAQELQILCRGMTSDADIVDAMACGATHLSGDFLAPARMLKNAKDATGNPAASSKS